VNKIKEKKYARPNISEILFQNNYFFYKIKLINIKKKCAKFKYKTKHFKKKYQDKPIELFFEDGHKINLF
jgi:hypothetical protein